MKKHKFKILTFVAVAAALAGTGCFKSIGYETFYVLRPWAQEGTVKTPIPREDMLAYAFDADTTEWSVLSYEDAVAGIITSRRTGEKLRPIAQGEPYEIDGNENWLAMQLNGPLVSHPGRGPVESALRIHRAGHRGESSADARERNLLPERKRQTFPEGQVDHVQRLLYGTRAGTGS